MGRVKGTKTCIASEFPDALGSLGRVLSVLGCCGRARSGGDDVEGAGGVEDTPDVSEALLAFLGRLPCPERPALALALLLACLKAWHL
jgi:hypothetical protein